MSARSQASPISGRKALSLITALFVLLTLFVSGPAQAAPPDPAKTGSGVPDTLQPCIGEALSSKAQQWVCSPAGLEIQVDGNGRSRARNQTPNVEPSQAPSPGEGRNQHSQEDSSGDVELMAGGTEYDTWCENGTICRRNITRYISETKGNAAYGNQYGVIGSYDVILRTNLNGRQANSSLAFVWDSGPSLSFYNTGIRCMEYATSTRPALNCGWHDASPMWVGPSKHRADSGLIYGNRLNNSNVYVNFAHTYFTPTGYGSYVAAQLEGMDFYCWGTGNCYFY
jgi:hypothetical protein